MIHCAHCDKMKPSLPATHQLLFRDSLGRYHVSMPVCDLCREAFRLKLGMVRIISSLVL